MKILFDQGVPVPLRRHLDDHEVSTAYELKWSTLKNGELLDAAEHDEFELLISTDQNLEYQQNLSGRSIAILILPTTAWPKIQEQVPRILDSLRAISPGGVMTVKFEPDTDK